MNDFGEHFPRREEEAGDNLPPEIPSDDFDRVPKEAMDRRRTWDDLSEYERELIIRSQTEDVESTQVPEVRATQVMGLVELLLEGGVVDAAEIDEDFIRYKLGLVHLASPYQIEECLERIKEEKSEESTDAKMQPIKLDDILAELELMDREKEYLEYLQSDIEFLTRVGVDYRQLNNMSKGSREDSDRIRQLAADLRSSSMSDIAKRYAEKFSRPGMQPEMISFESLSMSVLARKARLARQGAELLEGDEGALGRATRIYLEMIHTPEGAQELMSIMASAKQHNELEVVELLADLLRDNTVRLRSPRDFFGDNFVEWVEKK